MILLWLNWIGTIGFDLHQAFSMASQKNYLSRKVNLLPVKVQKKSVICLLDQTVVLKHHYLDPRKKKHSSAAANIWILFWVD